MNILENLKLKEKEIAKRYEELSSSIFFLRQQAKRMWHDLDTLRKEIKKYEK